MFLAVVWKQHKWHCVEWLWEVTFMAWRLVLVDTNSSKAKLFKGKSLTHTHILFDCLRLSLLSISVFSPLEGHKGRFESQGCSFG